MAAAQLRTPQAGIFQLVRKSSVQSDWDTKLSPYILSTHLTLTIKLPSMRELFQTTV